MLLSPKFRPDLTLEEFILSRDFQITHKEIRGGIVYQVYSILVYNKGTIDFIPQKSWGEIYIHVPIDFPPDYHIPKVIEFGVWNKRGFWKLRRSANFDDLKGLIEIFIQWNKQLNMGDQHILQNGGVL